MSRWGGVRVYWRYWKAFFLGTLLAVVQYGAWLFHRTPRLYFETVSKIAGVEIAFVVALIWIWAVIFSCLAALVSWGIVAGEKDVRGKEAFKPIPWDVDPSQPANVFCLIHYVSFFFWGQAVFWSVVTRFPPLSVNAGWKTIACLAGIFFAGAGVQIGARLVGDRYFYEGKAGRDEVQ